MVAVCLPPVLVIAGEPKEVKAVRGEKVHGQGVEPSRIVRPRFSAALGDRVGIPPN